MIKSTIEGIHPETKEEQKHTLEAEAICTVAVKENSDGGKIDTQISVMGSMDIETARAMINGLIGACREVLEGLDPIAAAFIVMKELHKIKPGESDDDVAGTSSEPERPAEQ